MNAREEARRAAALDREIARARKYWTAAVLDRAEEIGALVSERRQALEDYAAAAKQASAAIARVRALENRLGALVERGLS